MQGMTKFVELKKLNYCLRTGWCVFPFSVWVRDGVFRLSLSLSHFSIFAPKKKNEQRSESVSLENTRGTSGSIFNVLALDDSAIFE